MQQLIPKDVIKLLERIDEYKIALQEAHERIYELDKENKRIGFALKHKKQDLINMRKQLDESEKLISELTEENEYLKDIINRGFYNV